jgi:hypothetical protein
MFVAMLGSGSLLVKHELILGKCMFLWAQTALLFTLTKAFSPKLRQFQAMSQTTATTSDVKHLSSGPVFGLKGAIYLDPSGTFACIERAKAGTFAREFTETIQNDPHLKRFLSSLMVVLRQRLGASAQVWGQNLLTFRVIYQQAYEKALQLG